MRWASAKPGTAGLPCARQPTPCRSKSEPIAIRACRVTGGSWRRGSAPQRERGGADGVSRVHYLSFGTLQSGQTVRSERARPSRAARRLQWGVRGAWSRSRPGRALLGEPPHPARVAPKTVRRAVRAQPRPLRSSAPADTPAPRRASTSSRRSACIAVAPEHQPGELRQVMCDEVDLSLVLERRTGGRRRRLRRASGRAGR